MKILTPDVDIDIFFQKVAHASHRVLMLDYDGTLAPFHVERDKAIPYPGVNEVINKILSSTSTRLVIISGRAIVDLLPLLELDQQPEIWGSHGWELLTRKGERELPSLDNSAALALKTGLESIRSLDLAERIEQKPVSVAVHWRGLPDSVISTIRDNVMKAWQPLTEHSSLVIHPFDGGLELRVPGRDKGFSVRKILSEMPIDTIAAYLGDDLTDEDAFAALKGKGLSLLVRTEFRPTTADVWLQPPDELLLFLERWHYACLSTTK